MKLLLSIFVSLFIFLFPKKINRFFGRDVDFAFVANLRDMEDIINRPFPEKILATLYIKYFRFRWPFIITSVGGLKSCSGKKILGLVIICPLTAKQIVEDRKFAFNMIVKCIRLAEKVNAKSVNLAAFTSIVTNDGFGLNGKTSLRLTTGNTYSAYIAVQNVTELCRAVGLDLNKAKVAVVGAAGSVGSGCVKYLLDKVSDLILIDINWNELCKLESQVKSQLLKSRIKISENIAEIAGSDVIISATSALSRIIKDEYLKKGAIVIDAAHPRNVSKRIIKERSDVLVIHSAIAKVSGVQVNFDIGLAKEEVYGCLAESIIMAWLEKLPDNRYLGKVDAGLMIELAKVAPLAGVKLAPFRNALGPVTDENIKFANQLRSTV
ncbi:MAG: hypothetical protein JNN05_08155 [Candidatus Omnitrophica bacterium]|nr:hypothetical protein [Candidatus Omnitrophota bacterium]